MYKNILYQRTDLRMSRTIFIGWKETEGVGRESVFGSLSLFK